MFCRSSKDVQVQRELHATLRVRARSWVWDLFVSLDATSLTYYNRHHVIDRWKMHEASSMESFCAVRPYTFPELVLDLTTIGTTIITQASQ